VRSALLAREPALGPQVRAGLLAAEDHQVDPRRLLRAVTEAGRLAGVRRLDESVIGLAHDRVELAQGETVAAGIVVVAAGAWAAQLPGFDPVPVRPVKGQILRLRTPDGRPAAGPVVRGLVQGADVYVVPRADGEVVVGATSEERGFDTTSTAGALFALLRDARTLLPDLDEAVFVEHRVGFRPGTPDNGPYLGPIELDRTGRLVLAVGHHRNGVLLAPLTGAGVAAYLAGDDLPDVLAPFAAARAQESAWR
jgi:glycine oxidase